MAYSNDDEPENYLNCSSGFLSWALTLDTSASGSCTWWRILSSFFGGWACIALLVRTEHLSAQPRPSFDADTYNQLFTLHGAIMVFLFIIPSIPAALGNFVLPMMLGAKDVAFPRLNLASFYLWIVGALFALTARDRVLARQSTPAGPSTRPTAPTRARRHRDGRLGVFILGFSSIFTGLNFIVTIHKLRPPGNDVVQACRCSCGPSTRPRSSRSSPPRCSPSP